MSEKKEPLIKLELIEHSDVNNQELYENDLNKIEFEILSMTDESDYRKKENNDAIKELNYQIIAHNQKIDEIEAENERLVNHADGLDYIVAVASGLIAGLIDSFFVGEFSLERANKWGGENVNNFVLEISKKLGYEGDHLEGAIRYLEQYGIPSDSNTAKFGGSLQHHLRDFAHHPNVVGLFFSLLTQFTSKSYGTNTSGMFIVVDVENNKFIGEDFPKKILYGTVYWFLHLVSDMAGSSSTPGGGTGIPGPILSLAKEISALPIFNGTQFNDLKVKISKLFNGTLLAKRDEHGNIMKGVDGKPLIERFDLRTEIGIANEIARQTIPVILNEVMVRSFYFIRHLVSEIKNSNSFEEINWKNTLPFNNRTIARMVTISSGTFVCVDLADASIRAAIKSGGINPATLANFVLRVNFVGIGRFGIALFTDVHMGAKKAKNENERIALVNENLMLKVAKLYYCESNMWIEAESTNQLINEVGAMMENAAVELIETWNELEEGSKRRNYYIDEIKENDDEYRQELLNLMKWG